MSDDKGQPDGDGVKPTRDERARQQEDTALQARLGKLSAALQARKQSAAKQEQASAAGSSMGGDTGKAMSLGFRMLSDLVGGVLVGAAIGWGLDWLFSTSPFLLIVFLLLGTAGGFWNIIRTASKFPGTGKSEKSG